MIELTDDYWIYGFWIAPVPENVGRQGDWMAVVYRNLRRQQTVMKSRFRWYDETDPSKVWNSNDEKNWSTGRMDGLDEHRLHRCLAAVQLICVSLFLPDTVDFIDLQCSGGDPKVIEKLNESPHFYLRAATKEEFDQMRAPMN